jgi:hypothetical protein
MITDLIDDLAFDKISLSQGLTRSKILAYQINNETFQRWLKNELEGYAGKDNTPQYRTIQCKAVLTLADRWGQTNTIPIHFGEWKEMQERLTSHTVLLSIPTLEENIASIATETGIIEFPQEVTQMLYEPLKLREKGLIIKRAGQEINKLQLRNIIGLTKQKLIDTLLDIKKEIPDLNKNSKMSAEGKEKVQNIVTNNIFGSNNPLNLATGLNVKQRDFTINNSVDYSELEKLGVENDKIKELSSIVEDNKENPNVLKAKAGKWLGSVTASIAARGMYDKLPAIVEFVHNLI